MDELRQLSKEFKKWNKIDIYLIRIEAFINTDPLLIIDNCKCLIETICNTILEEQGIKLNPPPKLPELVKKTTLMLGIVSEVAGLNEAFTTLGQRLGTLRNKHSPLGHGHSIYEISTSEGIISIFSLNLLVSSTMALSTFLIRSYEEEYKFKSKLGINFEDNPELNEFLDESYEATEIGEYGPYQASEILFYVDQNAYITELNNFKQLKNEHE